MDELSDGVKDAISHCNGMEGGFATLQSMDSSRLDPGCSTVSEKAYKEMDLLSKLESRPCNSQPSNDTPYFSYLRLVETGGERYLTIPIRKLTLNRSLIGFLKVTSESNHGKELKKKAYT
ncbi:hypothetical protein PGTUg99_015616 [Puccinia graminis f. sp. tritici]|nr:hypothetical protein PGTUg99_015616 [Puccinia graminis f. sp. tritici]